MENWVPLFVAVVSGASAVGVALWTTRGESSDLRKLKAMNEALESLDSDDATRQAFARARDALAARIATRVAGVSPLPGVLGGIGTALTAGSLVIALLYAAGGPFEVDVETPIGALSYTGMVFVSLGALLIITVLVMQLVELRGQMRARSRRARQDVLELLDSEPGRPAVD